MGIAIILLTVLIKLVLWPLSKKTIEAQKKMKELQPKMQEIKKKYQDDRQKQGTEIMKLYKENKANPASSCLPLLLQLPILWAVFRVFRDGFKPETLNGLYSFVNKPETINKFFLGINYFNLAEPNIFLAGITALVQFWQTKMLAIDKTQTSKSEAQDENMQASLNKSMLYVMPVLTFIIGIRLPSALMLYWLISTLIMGLQQQWYFKKNGYIN